MLGVRLDKELEKQVEEYARKSGQSKSHCVKQALKEFLYKRKLKEEHDRRTLKGWQEIEDGSGVPAAEIFSYLDTWGTNDRL